MAAEETGHVTVRKIGHVTRAEEGHVTGEIGHVIGVNIIAARLGIRLIEEMMPSAYWRIVLTGTSQVTEVEARDRAVAEVEGTESRLTCVARR